jgi:2-hydroxy-6-oxonona-2,4-dienedioate hydrolase
MPQEHVFLLHGMFGKPEQWNACAAHLAGRWRTHTPLLPVLEVEPDHRAIEALGNRIIREMDEQGIGRAVIGGNSLGGHIATRMALCHPDRVSGLVLTGSSGLFERGFERKVPRRPTESFMRAKMREIFYDPAHVTDELVQDVGTFLADLHGKRTARPHPVFRMTRIRTHHE